mgnify:CR=1 FL=1
MSSRSRFFLSKSRETHDQTQAEQDDEDEDGDGTCNGLDPDFVGSGEAGVLDAEAMALHSELYEGARNHTVISYSSAWDALRETDDFFINFS